MYKVRRVVTFLLVFGAALIYLHGSFIVNVWRENRYRYKYIHHQSQFFVSSHHAKLCSWESKLNSNRSLILQNSIVDVISQDVGVVHNYENNSRKDSVRGHREENLTSENVYDDAHVPFRPPNASLFEKTNVLLKSISDTELMGQSVPIRRTQNDDFKEGRDIKNLSHETRTAEMVKNWRKLPKPLYKLAPSIFDSVPREFLPQFKNPCWYEEEKKLLCLPYFYILGFPKCGTTDMWDKINSHPDVEKTIIKEPQYWRDRRIGNDEREFKQYLSRANKLKSRLLSGDTQSVYCDASATTIISNYRFVPYSPKVTNDMYTNADIIHEITPNARIVIGIREPVERLFSGYLYHPTMKHRSASDFHREATKYVKDFQRCLKRSHKLRCIFEKVIEDGDSQRLKVGMYAPLIRHWITRFGFHQVMVIRLEDWKLQCSSILPKIFKFLDLKTLSERSIRNMCRKYSQNVNNATRKMIGEMWPSTKQLLQDFYAPFNMELSEYLNISVYHAQV